MTDKSSLSRAGYPIRVSIRRADASYEEGEGIP